MIPVKGDIKDALNKKGWVHLSNQDETKFHDIINVLGESIFTTEVLIKPQSKSMVTSSQGLNFHSDHPKANYIAWYCHEQTSEGGYSILIDAEKVYAKLSLEDQSALKKIKLKEHKVFEDDKDVYPFVQNIEGNLKFYFSFWLANENEKQNPAFLNFLKQIDNTEYVKLRLLENDVLIIDNDRFLHGRTAITGSKNRHLTRVWVSKNTFNKHSKTIPMSTTLVTPNSITNERISFLMSKKIDFDIATIDLEMVKMKLTEPKEGIGWTRDQVEDAEIEYKRYLHLTRHYPHPTYSIVPNKIMDTMWHYHILDTRAYHEDCERVFGKYLHHFPYFGLRGEEDEKNLKLQFVKTKEYYLQSFGESMTRENEADCWHDCENRCWHACSNN